MAFKLGYPLPEGELWGCLPCEMNAGRDADADVLLVEGEPGQRGVVRTGLCATHAEMLEVCGFEAIREAQRKYRELENEQDGRRAVRVPGFCVIVLDAQLIDQTYIRHFEDTPLGYLQAMKWAVRMEEVDIDSEKTVAQLREDYEKELKRSPREHWEAFEQQLASLQTQTDVLPAQLGQVSGDLKTAMSRYDVATSSFTTTLVEDLHEQEFTYTQMRAAVLSALKAMFSCVWMINPHSTQGEELRHCSREAFQAAAVRCYKREHKN